MAELQITEAADDEEARRLFAGLGLLARQYADALRHQRRPDDEAFFRIFDQVDGKMPGFEFPDDNLAEYKGPRCEQLLVQYAMDQTPSESVIAASPATIASIPSSELINEWTFLPGKEFFERFKAQWKITICGKDGPYDKFKNGLVGQAELPATLAATVLATGFGAAAFWYPLAIYIALLLIKTGLATYCEPASPNAK